MRLVDARRHILSWTRNYHKQWGPGTFWIIFGSKSTPNRPTMPRRHVMFSRTCIFPRKKKTAPPPKHMGCLHGWPWLAPKPDHPKNMVLVLIRPLVAPNPVLTGSPGRESRGGADYRVGVAPNIQKWTEIFGDPARSGRVWVGFSGLFPKWSGKVPRTIMWGSGGPEKVYLGV